MKYYDIYMSVKDDSKEGYSVFVAASDENEAVQVMTDNHLYEEDEDLDNIKSVSEITKEEYDAAMSATDAIAAKVCANIANTQKG